MAKAKVIAAASTILSTAHDAHLTGDDLSALSMDSTSPDVELKRQTSGEGVVGDDAGKDDEMLVDAAEGDIGSHPVNPVDDPLAGLRPSQEGRRVKVYELRESSWFDRGTGFCKGVYDDSQDLALIIVETEESLEKGGEASQDGPGGFLKEELLLNSRVEKEDVYARQQDTLIVWTEPLSALDIALSFQDAEGCDDIWQFIVEVQRHLNNIPSEAEQANVPSSSSPLSGSPIIGVGATAAAITETKATWQVPTLANIKEQEMLLRMQAKSAVGRERAVEHIIGEEYVKHLISVFEQAEDLESLDDLHALCSLMQTILLFNDNGIFEYILQDEIFIGVIGILEYDPDFPSLKASYRQFYQDTAKFRQVVEIRDPNIRNKIHQTYRLGFLKDVVLARVLDDPTFGILNGFVFFNQVDIVNHIQNNDSLLQELFNGFKDRPTDSKIEEPLDERKRDVVLFLHQLMHMGKGVQLPSRLALYRNLMERGLLFVCEWAFRRREARLLHAGAEILTLAVEHDCNAVRVHVLKEEEAKRTTLITEVTGLLQSTRNLGLLSQLSDTIRSLLESGSDGADAFTQRKEGPIPESFVAFFYENCAAAYYKPLLDLPEIKAKQESPVKLTREEMTLLQSIVELLSFCVGNAGQMHRASYFILSNPISKKIVSLLYLKDKPLRHAALRFVAACLKTHNHYLHRYMVKNELLLPLLDLLEDESARDNMLSSACMNVLDLIRKDNIKPVINSLFEEHRPRLECLAARPFLRAFVTGLTTRFDQNNEPPPPPAQPEAESSRWTRATEAEEEDYFNASDDEEIGPKLPAVPETKIVTWKKRKRMLPRGGAPKKRAGPVTKNGAALGLDYDDGSDSDGSAGSQSPRRGMPPATPPVITPSEELEKDLGDVALKIRAKRQREEEEEEGFASLVGKGGKKGA